jgi:magnesium transporter
VNAEHRLAKAFLESHPVRAARTLEHMPVPQSAAVLRAVPPESAAAVLRHLPTVDAARCLVHLEPGDAASIVERMRTDDAAFVLRAAERPGREQLLAAIPARTRDRLARLLSYPEGTAGAAMDPSVLQLPEDILIADARSRFRRAAREALHYLYVVDRAHRLVGVLDVSELMLARARDPLSVAMHRGVVCLSAWMPVSLVREHPGWQRHHAMPVVDEGDRLLGAIRYQTFRALEQQAGQGAVDPSVLTARALGEIFRLATTGLVAGVAAATSDQRDRQRVVGEASANAGGEVRDER